MSTTLLNSRFVRYVKRGRTEAPVSVTMMPSAVRQAYDALVNASWIRVPEKNSTLPRHNWAQSGHSNNFDAYRFCGDYANGSQHAYAGAVCYTYRIPSSVLGAETIEKITIPAYGDRWLADGVNVNIYTASGQFPQKLMGHGVVEMTGQLSVVPSNTGSDSSASLVYTPETPLSTSGVEYVHIVLYLTNYLKYRGAWIEGGAAIDGFNVLFQYSGTVTADTLNYFDAQDSQVFMYYAMEPTTTGTVAPIRTAYASRSHGFTSSALALRCWKGAVINFKTLPYTTAGVVSSTQGAYVIRGTGHLYAYTQQWYYAYGAAHKGRVTGMNLALEMTPTAGINIRLVVYAIPNGFSMVGGAHWFKTVKDTVLSLPSFWDGTATTITDNESSVALPCTTVLNTILFGGLTVASTYVWPINYTMTGPTSFLVVISVDSVDVSPGITELATYGLVPTPATTAFLFKA